MDTPAFEAEAERSVDRPRVGVGRRFLALVVDTTLWWVPYSVAVGGYTHDERGVFFTIEDGELWPLLLLLLVYFTVAEAVTGATLGKWLLRIRVRNGDGTPIGLRAAAIRNVLRIVDAFPYVIPYLVGAVAVWSVHDRQRVGDRAAGTVVVRSGR